MPINDSAIAAAAYAAAHNRSKGCPLLGQIAHGALMEFIAGKAHGSIASGPHPSNEVVMGKRVAEGQSEDPELKKDTDMVNDESSDLQGVEEIEIPIEDHHENQAESKISSDGEKIGYRESKISVEDRHELKVEVVLGYLYDEEGGVVKVSDDKPISSVHANSLVDLKVVQRSDEKSIAEKNSDEEELRAEGSIRVLFDELNSEAEEVKGKQFKESNDAESWGSTTTSSKVE